MSSSVSLSWAGRMPASTAEQMQVVIAEQHDRALAQVAHKTQRLQRLRPAVDDVADEYHATVARIAPTSVQAVGATLHIADGDNHGTGSTFAPIYFPARRRRTSAVVDRSCANAIATVRAPQVRASCASGTCAMS